VGALANFTDLAIDRTGQVFSLSFDVACGASRVALVQSNTVNVSYGMPFKLDLLGGTTSFCASPGCPFALQQRVMVQDKYGNLCAQVIITAVLLKEYTVLWGEAWVRSPPTPTHKKCLLSAVGDLK
jgi:hypothetical protein